MTMKKVPPPRLTAASLRSVSVLHVLPGGLERPLAVLQSWILFSHSWYFHGCAARSRSPLVSLLSGHPSLYDGGRAGFIRETDRLTCRPGAFPWNLEHGFHHPTPHGGLKCWPSGSASEIACLFQTFCVSLERRFDAPCKGRSVVITGKAVLFSTSKDKDIAKYL